MQITPSKHPNIPLYVKFRHMPGLAGLFQSTKKALGKGGHHLAPFQPSSHPMFRVLA